MGKIKVDKKITQSFIFLFIIITAIFACFLFLLHMFQQEDVDVNKIRLELSHIEYQISTNQEIEHLYFITNNQNMIIESNNETYNVDKVVNIKSFSSNSLVKEDNIFYISSPLFKENVFRGFLVVGFEDTTYLLTVIPSYYYFIILFLYLMILGIIYHIYRRLKVDLFYPIDEIHTLTNHMKQQDYEYQLRYDSESDIGILCHDIEMLRDELKYSEEVNFKLKENEKDLLASISHDLKTPLASVYGYVEGIKDGIVSTPEGIDHYCEVILNKMQMLNRLLDDIIDHSEIELNQFSIQLKEEYTKPIFQEMMEEFKIELKREKRNFHFSEIPNVIVLMDKRRIYQVMQNIISNAIKYTKEQGSIHVSFESYKDDFVVSIKDDGQGIASEDIPFIFHRFYRGEKARTMNVPGSGLGLSIAQNIISKHQGNMECESILGVGTIIYFSIKKG